MRGLINLLSANPKWNLLIALAYFLLVVLPHELVGHFTVWLFDNRLTRDDYNLVIAVLSFGGLLLYLFPVLKAVRKRKEDGKLILFYLCMTVVFAILSFKLLIVINIEVIHFIQYGFMAILLFPLVKRYGETLFWVTLLGAADEAYQYLYLAPQRTDYYDFNDVVINLLGGAFGLILVRSLRLDFALPGRKHFYRSPVFFTSLCLGLLTFVALKMEWLYVFPPMHEVSPLRLLVRVPQEGFWTTVHPDVMFHVVQPLEGVLAVGLLLLLYSGLGYKVPFLVR